VFGGGVPLVAAGRTVGAIGVSGGSSEQDATIAKAGAAVVT
ncbi:MAG: heme-binding protein, partial [Actinobacteria bacterium]|nr:heme-binding protein [Actinomycetota bacterium]